MVTVSYFFSVLQGLDSNDLIYTEINLNGGIVSNKGFIRQMAAPGTKIIAGKYISAWGGIQSAGQTVGQIVRPFGTSISGNTVTDCALAPSICHGKIRSESRALHHLA